MRKRYVLFTVAAAAATAAGVALATGDDGPRRAGLADNLTLRQLVGQRIVTGYVGTRPTRRVLTAVRRGSVGGVILFQNNIPSERVAKRSIAALQSAARAGGQPRLFVMIDQEGGKVKRLPDAPPRLSPRQMGRADDVAGVALAQGRATGRRLRSLGFNVDLAPVADVPSSTDNFLGDRAYGRDPETVAAGACGFARGLREAGVAATFKHFPGLGRADGDTDFEDIVIRATRDQIDADLAAYRRCPDAAALTMMSSARYPRLGSRRAAALTPTSYDLLGEQGFNGLTITDAFETPSIIAQRRPELRAIRSGADIVLYGQAFDLAMAASRKLVADAKAGRLGKAKLRADAERVLELKQRLERGQP